MCIRDRTEIPQGVQRVSALDVRALRERLTLLHTACREFEKISPMRKRQFTRRQFYATFKRILLAESKKMRESLRARKLRPTIRRGDIKILFTSGEGAHTTRVRDTVSSNENNYSDNTWQPRNMGIAVKWSDARGVPFEVYVSCGMEKGTKKLLIGMIMIEVGQVGFYTVLDNTQEFANMARAGTRRFAATRGKLIFHQRRAKTLVAIDMSRILELVWGVERKRIFVHSSDRERVSDVINQLQNGNRRFTVMPSNVTSNSNVSNSNNNNR